MTFIAILICNFFLKPSAITKFNFINFNQRQTNAEKPSEIKSFKKDQIDKHFNIRSQSKQK